MKISDFKLVNKLPTQFAVSAATAGQGQNLENFSQNQQGQGGFQQGLAGLQQHQQDSGHNKRQQLWKQYQEQFYGAS